MSDRTCLHCGRPFIHGGTGAKRSWCYECLPALGSIDRREYGYKSVALHLFKQSGEHGSCCTGRREKRSQPARPVCGWCRSSPTESGRRRFCGLECALEHKRSVGRERQRGVRRRKRRQRPLCLDCNLPIESHRHKCDACRDAGRQRSAEKKRCDKRYRRLRHTPNVCSLCGDSVPPGPTGRSRFRCDRCAYRIRRDSGRRHKNRRRTGRRAGAYTLLGIASRDGWRCGLCRRKVDARLSSRDDWGPTIDHILPISVGGLDEPANVQLAHRFCNLSKGNRPRNDQLRLVG